MVLGVKAVLAVLIACIVAGALVIAVMLRGPAWAWWVNPVALAVLAGTVPLLVALMLPPTWWRG